MIRLTLTDFGVFPDSGQDAVPALARALEPCAGAAESLLIIPPGKYDLFPDHAARVHYGMSNTEPINPRTVALLMRGLQNVTVQAPGAQFVYHGRMMPIAIEDCRGIRIEGLTIDAAVPSYCQGKVEAVAEDSIEICVEESVDLRVEHGKLVRYGEGWSRPVIGHQLVGRDGSVVYNTGDGPLGDLEATSLGGSRFRLRKPSSIEVKEGMYLILRSGWRDHSGVFIYRSSDVTLQDVTLHFANGTGILGQRSENVAMSRCRIVPKPGRRYSTFADATHWSGMKGSLTIEDCRFEGHLDDAANVHGTSVAVRERLSPRRLIGEFKHWESVDLLWAEPGDRITFFSRKTLAALTEGTVRSFEPLNAETFALEMEEDLPPAVSDETAMENATWNPDFVFRRNRVRRHRARGILVSTAGKMVIEENEFGSPGAAIVIAGDVNYWFESGPVRDVLIRNNLFNNCNTSGYGSGAAVIHIDPVIPEPDPALPCYHRNIRIEGNRFRVFDSPFVAALSVDGLSFQNNILIRSHVFAPRIGSPYGLVLDACRNVTVSGNRFRGAVPGRRIELRRMQQTDLTASGWERARARVRVVAVLACLLLGTGVVRRAVLACSEGQNDSVHFNSGGADFGLPPRLGVMWNEYNSRRSLEPDDGNSWSMAAVDRDTVLSQDHDDWLAYQRDTKLTHFRAEGLRCMENGDWPGARHQFAQAATLLPQDGDLRIRLDVIDRLKELPGAEAHALQQPAIHYMQGMQALDRKEYKTAQGLFSSLAASTASGFLREYALYQLASVDYALFDYSQARAGYRKLIAEYPHTALYERALIMDARASILPATGSGQDLAGGSAALQALQTRFPHSRFRASAQGLQARCLYLNEKYRQAAEIYCSLGDLPSAMQARDHLPEPERDKLTVRLTAACLWRLNAAKTFADYQAAIRATRIEVRNMNAATATLLASRLRADPSLLSPYLYFRLYHTNLSRKGLLGLARLADSVTAQYPETALPAAVRVSIAEVFYQNGDYRRAYIWASAANATHPSDRALWVQSASLQKLGRKREALQGFVTLLSRYPNSSLRHGAREEVAILSERLGDLASALTQYFQLGYQPDIAYLLDVRMSTRQIAAYLHSKPGQSTHPMEELHPWEDDDQKKEIRALTRRDLLCYSLGIRYLREEQWDDALRMLRGEKKVYEAFCSEASRNETHVPDPLQAAQDLRDLSRQVKRAHTPSQRAAAEFQYALYYSNHGSLLLYNPALWQFSREYNFDFYWNRNLETAQDTAAVHAYMYKHEAYARARALYLQIAARYPKSPFVPRALYHAACDAHQMAYFNQWWNAEAKHHDSSLESIRLMKQIVARYPRSPLAAHARKYAHVFKQYRAERAGGS
jgi:outer membrane protein assembly factor BamD (BamD/ComL family)